MAFQINFTTLLILGLCALPFYLLLRRKKSFESPLVRYSLLACLPARSGKAKWANTPGWLLWLTLLLFSLALADPRLFIPLKPGTAPPSAEPPVEGIAIYLVLDQSGSMVEKVAASGAGRRMISKIQLVKEVTAEFIQGDPKLGLPGRPNDLIGLIFFARGAHVEAPLTLEHAALLQQLSRFEHIKDPQQDGTAIGYAIYKAANLIAATRHYAQELIQKGEPAYTIKSSAIILLTDGLQEPSPLDKGKRLRNMDIPDAAAYVKSQKIHLYVINVEPKLATEEFAPYRHIMQRATESTGGKFYMLNGSNTLEEIYQQIDSLEKSAIPVQEIDKSLRPDLYRRVPLYPYLLAAALAAFFSAFMLETFWLRRVP